MYDWVEQDAHIAAVDKNLHTWPLDFLESRKIKIASDA